MKIKTYTFAPHGDDRGQLVAIEAMKDLPFEVKRVYYIYDTLPGVRRGFHAHKNLEQILLCVNGSCKIHLDDGTDTAEVTLAKGSVPPAPHLRGCRDTPAVPWPHLLASNTLS